MAGDLKSLLEADLGADKVSVELIPVDSTDKPKVYKIELDGEVYFDWVMGQGADGAPDVKVIAAPNDKWKTPLNFATHASYFGEGPKTELIDELKAAISAKC